MTEHFVIHMHLSQMAMQILLQLIRKILLALQNLLPAYAELISSICMSGF